MGIRSCAYLYVSLLKFSLNSLFRKKLLKFWDSEQVIVTLLLEFCYGIPKVWGFPLKRHAKFHAWKLYILNAIAISTPHWSVNPAAAPILMAGEYTPSTRYNYQIWALSERFPKSAVKFSGAYRYVSSKCARRSDVPEIYGLWRINTTEGSSLRYCWTGSAACNYHVRDQHYFVSICVIMHYIARQ
jgi:hypothetical protein